MATPEFMQRRMNRRAGSNIESLTKSFKSQAGALADQYQTEFAKYQQMVAEKMAPYQQAVANYKAITEPAYQQALSSYNDKLANYQQQLSEISANPVTERVERRVIGRKWYGKKIWGDVYFFDPKPMPTFTEKAPEIPGMPVAPEVAAFDSSAIDEKSKQLQSGFQREIGERKAGRLGAVQRKSRTMLGGIEK